MKNSWIVVFTLFFVLVFVVTVTAQRNPNKQKNQNKVAKTARVQRPAKTKVISARPSRFRYPRNQFPRTKIVVVRPRVKKIQVLAANHTRIIYRNRPYYYQEGRYYRFYNNSYWIIPPPRGIRIGFLPVGYRRVFVGNVSNYYYLGSYYRPVGNEYEAFEPNIGTIVPDLPPDNIEEVTIDGLTYYECNDILYKLITTTNGIEYEVVGKLND